MKDTVIDDLGFEKEVVVVDEGEIIKLLEEKLSCLKTFTQYMNTEEDKAQFTPILRALVIDDIIMRYYSGRTINLSKCYNAAVDFMKSKGLHAQFYPSYLGRKLTEYDRRKNR